MASACGVHKRRLLLLSWHSAGYPVWLQAKTWRDGKNLSKLSFNLNVGHNVYFYKKQCLCFLNSAGHMDGHVDRHISPNGYTSCHYLQNKVGETGTVTLN